MASSIARLHSIALINVMPMIPATESVRDTLLALGYNEREAKAAVKGIPAGTDVSEGVRLALKNLLK